MRCVASKCIFPNSCDHNNQCMQEEMDKARGVINKNQNIIFYLKYFSAITIVLAICLHAFNIHPLNVLIHFIGACTWSVVGFAWKEKSILLNFVPQVFILGGGLIYNYI